MRMRKLGKGQSIVFYISEEIQNKILSTTISTDPRTLNVSDVLIWSIHETYKDLRASVPLWATQGSRFERQKHIWETARTEDSYEITEDLAKNFLEDEAVSLDTRYRPRGGEEAGDVIPHTIASSRRKELLDRCAKFDCHKFGSATMQEEQERELSPEIEQERQIERPPKAKPLEHEMHKDVAAFVASGVIPKNSPAFLPAFQTLKRTSAAAFFELTKFPSELMVTKDFARTVEMATNESGVDTFQRPVQWILTSTSKSNMKDMVIISPFEAQKLKQRDGGPVQMRVNLHLYAPRHSPSFRPLDKLDLYTIGAAQLDAVAAVPPELRIQLNLFAGQLYFDSQDEYISACDYLCLASSMLHEDDEPGSPEIRVQADGFVVYSAAKNGSKEQKSGREGGEGRVQPSGLENQEDPEHSTVLAGRRFTASPVLFLRTHFTNVRHDFINIDRTHWGRVLSGELLGESDFVQLVAEVE
jgi:hypothetical protein